MLPRDITIPPGDITTDAEAMRRTPPIMGLGRLRKNATTLARLIFPYEGDMVSP